MKKGWRRILSLVLSFVLIYQQIGFAQALSELNIAGYLPGLSALRLEKFSPLHARYFLYDSPSGRFNLLLDKGDFSKIPNPKSQIRNKSQIQNPNLQTKALEEESQKIFNYFLIGLSLPNESFWVNLRPDSADQIIDPYLERTDIGKIFLEADVQLKKDLASLTSPSTPKGKLYWDRLYKKAYELFSQDNVTIPTLTRPWIVPGEVIVRYTDNSAYIYKANLKVLLEEDYLSSSLRGSTGPSLSLRDTPSGARGTEAISNLKQYEFKDPRQKALNEYSAQLIRELIIPELTKAVNTSKPYSNLRQVFYSLVLAQWFKAKYTNTATAYAKRINSKDLSGLTSATQWSKSAYFQQYQKSFKDGEYNIKESSGGLYGQTIRTYFSGGIKVTLAQPLAAGVPSRNGILPVEDTLRKDPNVTAFSAGPEGTVTAASPVEAGSSSPIAPELKRVNPYQLVNGLLDTYKAKAAAMRLAGIDKARVGKLEGIIRPTARAIEEYLYSQYAAQKIAAEVYQKGMANIIPNLAAWYTNPDIQDSTVLGIEDAVKEEYWAFIAQAYIDDIAYGTAGVRGKFAFGKYFKIVADAAKEGRGLKVPNLKGPNTFNDEIVRKFTLGVLKWLESENKGLKRSELKLFTAFDSRVAGQEFAQMVCDIGLAYGVQVYISDEAMPLPEFSCSLKELSGGSGAIGIYISASHNYKVDNGLKLIGSDGMQLGADGNMRKAIIKEFKGATLQEVAQLVKELPSQIPAGQLVFMGGKEDEKLPGVNYGNHALIDTHTIHAEAMRKHIKDPQVIKEHAAGIKILYCSFHGAGIKAMPRSLRAQGFNVEIVEAMGELDGTFPEFGDKEPPDPALVPTWKKAIAAYLTNHSREDLLEKDFFAASDPDADRFGLVVRVNADEIPEDEEVAEAMGVVIKLSKEEQKKYGYGGWRVIPPNEWNSLIAYYDLNWLKQQGKLDTNRYVIVFTHVTTFLLQKIADFFVIKTVVKGVGVDQVASEIVKLEKEGKEAILGGEESGTYSTSNHVRDKDGFLAGVRIAEIVCAARARGETLNDLLDEMYLNPKLGFFATTNFPIEYEVSVPGTAAKIAAVRFLQEKVKPAAELAMGWGINPQIAGQAIYAVDEQEPYRTGRYDDSLGYPNYPDAGIRFYFNPEQTSFITDRPSGTGPQLRFYTHLFFVTEGLNRAGLNQLKKKAYTECLEVTREWMRIVNEKDISPFSSAAASPVAQEGRKSSSSASVSYNFGWDLKQVSSPEHKKEGITERVPDGSVRATLRLAKGGLLNKDYEVEVTFREKASEETKLIITAEDYSQGYAELARKEIVIPQGQNAGKTILSLPSSTKNVVIRVEVANAASSPVASKQESGSEIYKLIQTMDDKAKQIISDKHNLAYLLLLVRQRKWQGILNHPVFARAFEEATRENGIASQDVRDWHRKVFLKAIIFYLFQEFILKQEAEKEKAQLRQEDREARKALDDSFNLVFDDYLRGEQGSAASSVQDVGSVGSPLRQDANIPETTGGIDMSVIKALSQPMNAGKLSFKLPAAEVLAKIDLSSEGLQLLDMMEKGFSPSAQRMMEYVTACLLNRRAGKYLDEAALCLVRFFKLQEETVTETAPEFRQFLYLIESGKLPS